MHFTVGVITTNPSLEEVENLLAPFDENIKVKPYIYQAKQEIIDNEKRSAEGLRKDIKDYSEDNYDSNGAIPYWFDTNERYVNPPKMKEFYQKLLSCNTDEDYYRFYRRYNEDCNFDENGNELTTYNPDSKWDWYSIGGRWDGMFDKENGENTLLIKDIKWDNSTEEEKEYYKRYWEVVVEGQPLKEDEDKMKFFSLYKKEYYIDFYHTKEEYVERATKNHTYAVITPEGEWIAPGEMGWFSSSESPDDQNKYEEWFYKYMEEHPDYYLTLVDCHI